MSHTERFLRDIIVLAVGAIFLSGFVALAVNLRRIQIDSAAEYNFEKLRQCSRLVQLAAPRGRILDSRGRVLAANRSSLSIALEPSFFQRRSFANTAVAITNAIVEASKILGKAPPPSSLSITAVRRHLARSLALPYVVWRDADEKTVARFAEQGDLLDGFLCVEGFERRYPYGPMACHIIGYVGRGDPDETLGDQKMNFREKELVGRSGIELYLNSYLRGVSGERRLVVDARGYTVKEEVVRPPHPGPDLKLTLDAQLQIFVERQLRGLKGACVVLNPRTGAVLAIASAPSYNLNEFVPFLPVSVYSSVTNNIDKPLLNRACGSIYAPGSVFKPITAFAALRAGRSSSYKHFCDGVFRLGTMRLRCASRWGHGDLDMAEALRDSCNPYFADAGIEAGTNILYKTAKKFGLGSPTGIDFPVDNPGLVPDGYPNSFSPFKWTAGDLPQAAIGQGRLLVTPLQMAVCVGAIGTGSLCRPRLNVETPVCVKKVDVPQSHFDIVRKGMRLVVLSSGTGKRASEGVEAYIIGKTGTAEVGSRANRRKNTWFIAYAKADGSTVKKVDADKREVALAIVIEDGESGGLTAAPKACEILKNIYNRS